MPWVGFEPMIPVFEQAKAAHVLDRAATVSGPLGSYPGLYLTKSSTRGSLSRLLA
jgi:hypothetical protein